MLCSADAAQHLVCSSSPGLVSLLQLGTAGQGEVQAVLLPQHSAQAPLGMTQPRVHARPGPHPCCPKEDSPGLLSALQHSVNDRGSLQHTGLMLWPCCDSVRWAPSIRQKWGCSTPIEVKVTNRDKTWLVMLVLVHLPVKRRCMVVHKAHIGYGHRPASMLTAGERT